MSTSRPALTWLRCHRAQLQDGGEGLLSRRMQHNRQRASDAQDATQQAEQVEPLVEHQVRQHSTAGTMRCQKVCMLQLAELPATRAATSR